MTAADAEPTTTAPVARRGRAKVRIVYEGGSAKARMWLSPYWGAVSVVPCTSDVVGASLDALSDAVLLAVRYDWAAVAVTVEVPSVAALLTGTMRARGTYTQWSRLQQALGFARANGVPVVLVEHGRRTLLNPPLTPRWER